MTLNTDELQYFLEMAGTVAFAVTAVLAVTPRGIDLFGACVMGVICSPICPQPELDFSGF